MNKLIFTGLFFISFAYGYAQKFVNIGVENGLSAHQAYNIVEDANGFFWVSTKDGIDRYNGETTLNYKISNPNNLGSHRRFKITKDNSVDIDTHMALDLDKDLVQKTIDSNRTFLLPQVVDGTFKVDTRTLQPFTNYQMLIVSLCLKSVPKL